MTMTHGRDDRTPLGRSVTAQAARPHQGWLALAALLMVAGCAGATWWQVQRALHGDLLSDFYAVMWPIYGGYVIYLWLHLRRDAASVAAAAPRPDPVPQPDENDEELRAYNRYLAGKRADAQHRGRR
ncbi:MAG: hypothetical protein ACRDOI_06360 [Trebonia sp.]